MGKNKTIADRQQYVVKANSLIRTRYRLTLQQQRLVLFCISKIRPQDMIGQEYTFTIEEICNACGLDRDAGGMYYKTIKEDLLKLTDRKWGVLPTGEHITISWIGDVKITPYSGTVSIKFNPNMAPYLYDLHEHYTQYKLENALVFKSRHSLHLYEILRSYTTQRALDEGWERSVMFSVEELRELLDCSGYARWSEFDRCVLKKAVKEINACCDDIHIEVETYKRGRRISSVEFIITSPKAMDIILARRNKRERLK